MATKTTKPTNRGAAYRRSKRTARTVDRASRMEQALKLRLQDKTFREIAAELHISVGAAHDLVKDALAALAPIEHAEELRQVKLEQLRLLSNHWLPAALTSQEPESPASGSATSRSSTARDALLAWLKITDTIIRLAGLDKLEPPAPRDPNQMNLAEIDQELRILLSRFT